MSFAVARDTAPPLEAKPAPASERITGIDLARSFAILGMILVHFSLVMASDRQSPSWLAAIIDFLDGRAAATFVVLAGVGITLLSRRAVHAGDPAELTRIRNSLLKRGVFLFLLGCANLTIWTGDILRVYGITFLIAPWFLRAANRTLLIIAAMFVAGFIGLMQCLDFNQNWEWETLSYQNLWTVVGFVRNLLFDGFRSVFPWSGLVFFGMWLGRLPLSDPRISRRVFVISVLTVVATEIVSALLVRIATAQGADRETAIALWGTTSMPALPIFLCTALGTAVAVITTAVGLGNDSQRRWLLAPFADAGRMALTWYLGHIVVGLGAVVAAHQDGRHTLPMAVATGLAFYLAAAGASWIWMQRFRLGPLEIVMRALCG